MATAPLIRFTAQQVSHAIITAAMKAHTELGPGLLESTYTACLQYELGRAGVQSAAQVGLPVVYCGVKLELGYRIDLLVEDLVVLEKVGRGHRSDPSGSDPFVSQTQWQIARTAYKLHVVHLKDGIKRFVNGTDWK